MTIEEQLSALLIWRKGVLLDLKRIPVLESQTKALAKRISALEKKDGRPVPEAKVVKVDTASKEQVEEAFQLLFEEADNEDDGQWFTVTDLVNALSVKTTSYVLGRVLSGGLGILSTPRRVAGRIVRCYFLKKV